MNSKPKKIISTQPLIARRVVIPNMIKGDWKKVKRTFPLIKPSVKGNRFLW